MPPITRDELDDEQIEKFLGSKLFQKFYAYRSLTDGINALKENEAMFETLVDGVMRRQSRLSSRDTIEEVLDALVEEVEDNTDFIEEAEETKTVTTMYESDE